MKTYILTQELLDELIEYIKDCEEVIDGEWGYNRKFEKMVEDGISPDVYHKLLALKDV